MGVLDGKVAIVTGSARGIGRATAGLLAEHGARVLVTDLDVGVAEAAAAGISGETAVYGGDLTKDGVPEARRPAGDRRLRAARHRRQQRRLHLGRHGAQDERRAVPRHARDPHRRPVQAAPCGGAVHARRREGREGGGPRGLPQGGERHVDLRDAGQPRPGELLGGEGRAGRAHEDARAGVGAVQGERQRGRVRLRRDAPHRRLGRRRRELRQGRRRDPARHPGADATDGADRSSRSAGRRRPTTRPARSSSSAHRGRTSSTARCSPRAAARRPA